MRASAILPGQPHTLPRVWRTLRYRCYDPRHPEWPVYGAQGVGVWSGWAFYPCFEQDRP